MRLKVQNVSSAYRYLLPKDNIIILTRNKSHASRLGYETSLFEGDTVRVIPRLTSTTRFKTSVVSRGTFR